MRAFYLSLALVALCFSSHAQGSLSVDSLAAFSGLGSTNAAPPNDITYLLVARYSLAGNVNDLFGNNGTTAVSATYTTGPLGTANGALNMDGTSQYVAIGHPTLYDFGAGDFTFVIWFKTTTTSGNQMLFACDDASSGRQFNFDINGNGGDGSIEESILNDAATPPYSIYSSGPAIISAGTWYQAILVRSGNSPGAMHLYLNGVAQTFTVFTGFSVSDFPFTMKTTTSDVEIGRRSYSGANNYFSGAQSSLSVYNRAFSPTEASNSYSYGPK
jgi:hypothetical protein